MMKQRETYYQDIFKNGYLTYFIMFVQLNGMFHWSSFQASNKKYKKVASYIPPPTFWTKEISSSSSLQSSFVVLARCLTS